MDNVVNERPCPRRNTDIEVIARDVLPDMANHVIWRNLIHAEVPIPVC